jgi:hypothetical protein
MGIFKSLGMIVLAAMLTTGIARADLWVNIHGPLVVGDTNTLPGQGCELMQRKSTEDVVRCSKGTHDYWRHIDLKGANGSHCRFNFKSNPLVREGYDFIKETKGACRAGYNNRNTVWVRQP